MPEEILWKATVAFGALLLVVFGGVALLRILPHRRSRVVNEAEREALEDFHGRLGELDQLQERVIELEERLDFAERTLAKQRDGERLAAPKD